jgi:hypothetical protein
MRDGRGGVMRSFMEDTLNEMRDHHSNGRKSVVAREPGKCNPEDVRV